MNGQMATSNYKIILLATLIAFFVVVIVVNKILQPSWKEQALELALWKSDNNEMLIDIQKEFDVVIDEQLIKEGPIIIYITKASEEGDVSKAIHHVMKLRPPCLVTGSSVDKSNMATGKVINKYNQILMHLNNGSEDALLTIRDSDQLSYGVDWRAEDDGIIAGVGKYLGISLKPIWKGDDLNIQYNDKLIPVPLQLNSGDRYRTIFSIKKFLAKEYDVRVLTLSLDEDTHSLVILSNQEWRDLEAECVNDVNKFMTKIVDDKNLFDAEINDSESAKLFEGDFLKPIKELQQMKPGERYAKGLADPNLAKSIGHFPKELEKLKTAYYMPAIMQGGSRLHASFQNSNPQAVWDKYAEKFSYTAEGPIDGWISDGKNLNNDKPLPQYITNEEQGQFGKGWKIGVIESKPYKETGTFIWNHGKMHGLAINVEDQLIYYFAESW